jgi:hypothetical protein
MKRRRVWAVMLVAAVCVVALVCARHHAGHQLYLSKLAAIRAMGGPVTLEELNDFYGSPAPEQNAAPIYEQVFNARNGRNRKSLSLPVVGHAALGRSDRMPEEMKQAMARYLNANKQEINLLQYAASLPRYRAPVDFVASPAGDASPMKGFRDAHRLLWLEAVFHAEKQDADNACKSVLTALATSRALRQEPTILAQLTWVACIGLVFDSLEQVLNRTSLTDGQLADLERAFASADTTEYVTRALLGDLCFTVYSLDTGEDLWMPLSLWKSGLLRGVTGVLDVGLGLFIQSFSICTGSRGVQKANMVDAMCQLAGASTQTFPGALKAADSAERDFLQMSLLQRGHGFSVLCVRNTKGAIGCEAMALAYVRVARTGLAAERYRLANRRLPNQLGDLLATFLAAVPEDPFDGAPLRYRLTTDGYLVYSVGPDCLDDGGKERQRDSGDIVLTVERPADR